MASRRIRSSGENDAAPRARHIGLPCRQDAARRAAGVQRLRSRGGQPHGGTDPRAHDRPDGMGRVDRARQSDLARLAGPGLGRRRAALLHRAGRVRRGVERDAARCRARGAVVPGARCRRAAAHGAAGDDAPSRRRADPRRELLRGRHRDRARGDRSGHAAAGVRVIRQLAAGNWRPRLAVIACVVCFSAGVFGQTYKAPPATFADTDRRAKLEKAFPDIDRLVEKYAADTHVPGAAWGVIVDGELAHTGVTGYRDVPSKAPVTPDTVFRIASMTKSFTAMAILKLRDEGKLSLDDPAEKYVPEMKALVYPTADSPKITIRHLLSHAEGFPEDNPWGDQQLADSDEQLSALIKAGIPFSNAPGIAYEYSNFGFAILGRIVGNISHAIHGARGLPAGAADTPTADYTRYVTENILKPLGM